MDIKPSIADRFRGFLPVVVDVETAGFNAQTDALLEIAAVIIELDGDGRLIPGETIHCHVEPFHGANLEQSALDFTGIDPYNPLRLAVSEADALQQIFSPIRQAVKHSGCTRAIMVAHNPIFDMGFVNAAVERTKYKRNPFHPFSSFDTVTLGGLAYGQTVLARIGQAAGIKWNESEAHSAKYDAEQTATIFCTIVNQWDSFSKTTASSD